MFITKTRTKKINEMKSFKSSVYVMELGYFLKEFLKGGVQPRRPWSEHKYYM